MKVFMTLLTFFIVISCSHVDQGEAEFDENTLVDMDAILATYDKFDKEFGVSSDSRIFFDKESWKDLSTSGSGVQATCFVQGNVITIDHRFWVQSDARVKEALLFHELGHCMLGLGHDAFPSIMNNFIGHTVNHYAYWYEDSIDYMKTAPCQYGCDLERIILNRSKYVKSKSNEVN